MEKIEKLELNYWDSSLRKGWYFIYTTYVKCFVNETSEHIICVSSEEINVLSDLINLRSGYDELKNTKAPCGLIYPPLYDDDYSFYKEDYDKWKEIMKKEAEKEIQYCEVLKEPCVFETLEDAKFDYRVSRVITLSDFKLLENIFKGE